MDTGQIHVQLDPITKQKFIEIVGRGNVSRILIEYINNSIATYNKDISGINIALINQKIEILTKNLSKTQSELQNLASLKDEFERQKLVSEEKRLLEEKGRIELMYKCVVCGLVFNDDSKLFRLGEKVFCRGCYHNLDGKELKKYGFNPDLGVSIGKEGGDFDGK